MVAILDALYSQSGKMLASTWPTPTWVITDAFLGMLDDLRERLARWLAEE
jgi:hypothetical protein